MDNSTRTSRSENPVAFINNDDLFAVDTRIKVVINSLRSIHCLAGRAIDTSNVESELFLVAIQEMARSNIKGLDACLARMTNDPMGNFETEFAIT